MIQLSEMKIILEMERLLELLDSPFKKHDEERELADLYERHVSSERIGALIGALKTMEGASGFWVDCKTALDKLNQ
jgi:hypothetical protein